MEPSFGDLQTVVIAVFGALALALAAVFALVAPQTRRDVHAWGRARAAAASQIPLALRPQT